MIHTVTASIACAVLLAGPALADVQLRFETVSATDQPIKLVGSDARVQLLVARQQADGLTTDQTRQVRYQTNPDGIVVIDETGLVKPLADGEVQVVAESEDGVTATTTLVVSGTNESQPVSFCGQVIPIFTKLGCNGGGCHGKIAGQNGFRLSLLGFEPQEDHKRLVAESRGRRVSTALPDRSLLLMKTVNAMPHGGGARTERDSHEYRVLRRWIAQGMPYDYGEIPTVTSIRITPSVRRLQTGTTQQLSVIATYSDGAVMDVTRAAVYESNDPQMAEVSTTGLVQIGQMVGDVAVMARYQGQVGVFRAEIPLRLDAPGEWLVESDNVVDRFVNQKLQSLGIPPSPRCDDATFVRRVTLDLTGRIPSLDEVNRFLNDGSEEKRSRLIDRLLATDDYAAFFARKWGLVLRNRRSSSELQVQNVLFHHWLEDSFRENRPYDQLVSELLTARGDVYSNPATAWLDQVSDQNERVEDVSQLFLGQRIQCARCHHHPYEKWSQEDYARLSAFFSTISKKSGGGDTTFVSRVAAATAKHPKTGESLGPAGLDGDAIDLKPTEDPRQALADWITTMDNPFFAKSLVNRYWKHFMGRGLVEPEDDLRVTNPPSNPELMNGLAESFTESGFDLKSLIRTICNSATYQTSSDANAINVMDRRSYSRYYPKRLQAETLLDSIDSVTGATTDFAGMPAGTRAVQLPDTGFSSYFLTVFGQPDAKTACECERSSEANLAQSLHLLNSEQMQQKLSVPSGRSADYAADTDRSVSDKVIELYLIAFSRSPSEDELETALGFLGDRHDQKEPWEDLIWVLVNSKEFLFNH